MALSDLTAEGVKRAVHEFDRLGRETFLAQYGFWQAWGYFLVHGGHRYDSKAVVGVAHRYDRPDLGPLQSQDFSGGRDTVAPLLESLGFEVETVPRNPSWAERELILALDLYLRSGPLDDKEQGVTDLSRDLNALTVHAERPKEARFHNPTGVALKLADFAALDPNYPGRGLRRGRRRDSVVWDRYALDEDLLAETAKAIREGRERPAARDPEPRQLHVIEGEV